MIYKIFTYIISLENYTTANNGTYKAVCQVLTDFCLFKQINVPCMAILTNYFATYVLCILDNKKIFISKPIGPENFVLVVLFVLSFNYNVSSLYQVFFHNLDISEFIINKLEKSWINNQDKKSLNKSNRSNNGNFNQNEKDKITESEALMVEKLNDSGIVMDKPISADLLYNSMLLWEMIGFGACATVYKFQIRNQIFAVKVCDSFKSSKMALDELKNEYIILNECNKKASMYLYYQYLIQYISYLFYTNRVYFIKFILLF